MSSGTSSNTIKLIKGKFPDLQHRL